MAIWGAAHPAYLPMYKSNLCIKVDPPILEPKNKYFLFLGKNFLENLNIYLRARFFIQNSGIGTLGAE